MKDKQGKRRGSILLSLLILIVVIYSYSKISGVEHVTGRSSEELQKEYGKPIAVFFCPRDNCTAAAITAMNEAKESLHCAFYDLDIEEIINLLNKKSKDIDVKVVVDKDNFKPFENTPFIKTNPGYQLMHNKFCTIDGKKMFTGSFNPTFRDGNKNNNNLIMIQSADLAANYETEFQELWSGVFGNGGKNKNPDVYYNNIEIENYFCPEDWCGNKIIYALSNAQKEIKFMTFSFTHDEIGDMLIKKASEGVKVSGVFEKTQNNAYTEYDKLKNASIDVRWDGNSNNMHHKVFIIDDQIVITGSFNPSANADTRNDENVLIIHDPGITSMYSSEFSKVWEEANQP